MKKFLSMLLVLCMVFTTLMGTMVVDVNAAYSFAKNEDSTLTHTYTFNESRRGWDVGTWVLQNVDGTSKATLGTTADIGELSFVDGLYGKAFDFTAGSITGVELSSSLGLRAEIFNGVVSKKAYYLSESDDAYSMGDVMGTEYFTGAQLNTAIKFNTADNEFGKVIKATFYAYSEHNDGEPVRFSLLYDTADCFNIDVPASVLYSQYGLPHKIEVMLYTNGESDKPLADDALEFKVYVDGVYYNGASKKLGKSDGRYGAFAPSVNLVSSAGNLSWKDTKIHIYVPKRANSKDQSFDLYKNVKLFARTDLANNFFQAVDFDNLSAGADRSDIATGLVPSVENSVESAYTAPAGGDRVVYLPDEYYNKPASIFDGTTTNVAVVDKDANPITDMSGDFSNKYLMVNGVFAKVEKTYFWKEGNDITYTLNADELKGFDVGNWKLSNGTTTEVLGTTSDNVEVAGMKFKKIQLTAGELTGLAEDATSIQIRTDIHNGIGESKYLSGDIDYTAEDMAQQTLTIQDLLDNTLGSTSHNSDEGVVVYTLYAYSAKTTGQPLVLGLTADGIDDTDTGRVTSIPVEKLYSADGTPHKIDIVVFKRNSGSAFYKSQYAQARVYIDGLMYKGWHGDDIITGTKAASKIAPTLSLKLTPADGKLSWVDTEWYIFSPDTSLAESYITKATKGIVEDSTKPVVTDLVFESTIPWGTQGTPSTAGTIKTDVVNGVTADVDAKLNAVLLSKTVDNVIELPESIYNNPVAIFDGTSTNVKLIDKVTGVEYTSATIDNKTFDNMYICVDGVYVLVKSVPDADLTYDKIQKLASVRANLLSAGTTCQIVVAAYNDDKLADIKVSGQLTAEADNAVEYTANGIAEGAEEYKIFVFDALNTIKPLVEALIVR